MSADKDFEHVSTHGFDPEMLIPDGYDELDIHCFLVAFAKAGEPIPKELEPYHLEVIRRSYAALGGRTHQKIDNRRKWMDRVFNTRCCWWDTECTEDEAMDTIAKQCYTTADTLRKHYKAADYRKARDIADRLMHLELCNPLEDTDYSDQEDQEEPPALFT